MRQIILNIHGIGTPKRELEPDEAEYWISPEFFAHAVETAKASSHDVQFTFDDGNLSDLEIGAPILNDAGMTAQFFVLAGRLGTAGSLGPADLVALQDMGHSIGSHGWGHVDWTKTEGQTRAQELSEAKAVLEEACGRKMTAAGIPFGRYNASVLKAVRAAGFTTAYSSDGGAVSGRPFPIPRSSLTHAMTQKDLDDILAGREPLKRSLRRHVTTRLKRIL